MKFICLKEELQKSLSIAESIVSTKTTLPILSNVLLEAKDNKLNISSTDLEVSFKTSISSDIQIEESITIQAKKLSELIKSFDDCKLDFSLDKQNTMKISAEDSNIKATFKIMGIPKDDYPKIPEFENINVFSLSQSLFRDMIDKTIFSTSTDEARYFLNGIYFEKKDDILTLVATDGKRLSKISCPIDSKLDDFEVIVPSKVLYELMKILNSDGMCQIAITDRKAFFKVDDTEMVSNLLEGQFPNYRQVIPSESTNILTVDNMAIYDGIKRVSHMIDPRLAQIRFDLIDNSLTLYGYHPDFGEAKDEISLNYKGDDLTIAFNYNYLLDALKKIDHKEVTMMMTSNNNPVIIKGIDDEDYISVIMPMKIADD